MTRKHPAERRTRKRVAAATNRLYTLEVFLLSGMVTEEFVKANPSISRTIQIKGGQTLQALHRAIFRAFDREEEHLYEFQFGKGPHDPKGPRYTLSMNTKSFVDDEPDAGDVAKTTIDSLGLKQGRSFGYWFDFGDNWMHQINVLAIKGAPSTGRFPKITKRVGESPPQYPDLDEER
jgi:hypothetical protein